MPNIGIMADSYKVPSGGGSWLPSDIGATLELWFDASDAATVIHTAGAVSAWNDKSGKGRHFTQATGANQPATGTRTLNGLNVIDFGGDDGLINNMTGITLSQPLSIFSVMLSDTIAAGIGRVIGRNTSASFNFGRNASSAQYAAGSGRSIAGAVAVGVAFQMTAFFQDTLSRLRVNGVQGHDGTASSPGTGGLGVSGTPTGIGFQSAASVPWDGTVAEIIVTSTNLNGTPTMTSCESYLKAKWGTP